MQPGGSVDELPDDVRVPGVPLRFGDHVGEDPVQRDAAPPWLEDDAEINVDMWATADESRADISFGSDVVVRQVCPNSSTSSKTSLRWLCTVATSSTPPQEGPTYQDHDFDRHRRSAWLGR
jgi:hypothetical protein